ncbi:tellurite resistance TerB family protein [Microvirga massiliensis]|uniref:tellurite resistance TerB family protein n=1 Tax=Microvirga massiliensis TaxID=1033741 RepID=UPI0006609693|nr:DUF533 domain-containing protein [Microvirga massiliensis]
MANLPFDPKRLLDSLIGAAASIGQPAEPTNSSSPQGKMGPTVDLGPQVTNTVEKVTGQTPDQLLQKAKSVIEQHPGLAQAAAIGLAGLLFGPRKSGSGISSALARLGGLAVIGGLAYKAFQNRQAGKPLLADVQTPAASGGDSSQTPQRAQEGTSSGRPLATVSGTGASGAGAEDFDVPQESPFHPVSQTEDDVLLYLRAMAAAAAADGHVDEAERNRIIRGLRDSGIGPQASDWLEREFASPADVDELAAQARSPEKAAQVYAAARIAIDPDTLQEREFLNRLAEALDLDQAIRSHLDDTTSSAKA